MTITRLDWWLGVGVLALVLLVHALGPRYQVLPPGHPLETPFVFARIDRWLGTIETANLATLPWIHVTGAPRRELPRTEHGAPDVTTPHTTGRPSESRPDCGFA
jgi:hypothetical protein